MVEPNEVRAIDCACGKAFIWASEVGIEWQCRSCGRRTLVPFGELRGREHLERAVDEWRRAERQR